MIKLFLSVLFVCAFLGCGNRTENIADNVASRKDNKSGVSFMSNSELLTLSTSEVKDGVLLCQDAYLYKNESNNGTIKLVLKEFKSSEEKTLFETAEGEQLIDVDMDEKGFVAIVVSQPDADKRENIILHLFDDNQTEILAKDLSEHIVENYPVSVKVYRESVYVTFIDCFWELDNKGDILRKYVFKNDEKACSYIPRESDIILYGQNHGKPWYKVIDRATFKELDSAVFNKARVWAGGRNSLFYYTIDGLVKEGLSNELDEIIFNFSDININTVNVKQFYDFAENEYLFLEASEEGVELVTVRPADEKYVVEDTRQKLNLLCANLSLFQGTVIGFNSESENYKLNILPGVSFERYNAIALSNDYDLIEIPGGSLYEDYVQNGYIIEIDSYLDGALFKKEDYLDRIFEDLSINGKIYAIPLQMYLTNLWVPEDLLGGKTSWNIYEYIDFMKQYPDALTLSSYTDIAEIKSRVLYVALIGAAEELMEGELKKDELSSIIREIGTLEIKGNSADIEDRLKAGDSVILKADIDAADMLADTQSRVERKLIPIGFPTMGGIESGGIIDYFNMVGISPKSKDPIGAWSFIEYRLNSKSLDNFKNTPTRVADFEMRMEQSSYEEETIINGTRYYPVSKEDSDKMKEAYRHARLYNSMQREFVDIAVEEATYYFSGQKKIDDVLDIILSRTNLMISEHS